MKILGILGGALVLAVAALLFLTGDGARGELEPTSARRPPRTIPAAPRSTELDGAGDKAEGSPAPSTRTAAPVRSEPKGARPSPAATRRTFSGNVVAASGGMHGAEVLLHADGELVDEASTDERGHFSVSCEVPCEDVVLRVSQRGFAALDRALGMQRVPGQQLLGNLLLRPGTVLSGIVENEVGEPVDDALVVLSTLRGRTTESSFGERTTTGVDGRFEFPSVGQGPVELTARARTYGEVTLQHMHQPGSHARLVLVPGHELLLRVVDQDGEAVDGIRVTIRSNDPRATPRERDTDDEGRVVFGGLASEEWSVRVMHPAFRPAGLSQAFADGTETEVRMTRWPCVVAHVQTVGGDPPPAGSIAHALPAAARGDLVSQLPGGEPIGADGALRVCGLRVGEYRVHVIAPGFAETISTAFVVPEIGDVDLGRILLEEGGGLVLSLSADGKPAPGVRADVLQAPPVPAQLWLGPRVSAGSPVVSDAEGTLELGNLTPGNVWLVLWGENVVPKSLGPLRVASGTPRALDPIELIPAGRIRGRVQTAAGTAAVRARVRVEGDVATIPYIATDEAGMFVTPPLPPGSYSVEARSVAEGELYMAGPETVILDAGEDSSIELELGRNVSGR